jgi:hypothetical protein
MSNLAYTKTATYVQPAWTTQQGFIDGIYVDDVLFANNIPIIRAEMSIWVEPESHLRQRTIYISIPTFENGSVSAITRIFTWLPLQHDVKSLWLEFPNNFYGIGLNVFYIATMVDLPTNASVTWTVKYVLVVTY